MNETNNQIIDTTLSQTPQQVMSMVSQVAAATKALVGNSVINLQGKKYIKVEGWQAIAAAHGCTVTADEVAAIDGGIVSVAKVRRLRDNAVLGQAEGFVGEDEVWGKRPMYAQRAMAQTRAISRACRNAFAHIVVAMNADFKTGFETTPAEEVPEEGFKKTATVTGEVQKKMPSWTDEQRSEAGKIRAELLEIDLAADKDLVELRARMKYDAPADVIDALYVLLAKWRDIQDQNNHEAASPANNQG